MIYTILATVTAEVTHALCPSLEIANAILHRNAQGGSCNEVGLECKARWFRVVTGSGTGTVDGGMHVDWWEEGGEDVAVHVIQSHPTFSGGNSVEVSCYMCK